jgi:hypothetical protein
MFILFSFLGLTFDLPDLAALPGKTGVELAVFRSAEPLLPSQLANSRPASAIRNIGVPRGKSGRSVIAAIARSFLTLKSPAFQLSVNFD